MNLTDSPGRPACPSRASSWSSLTTPWGLPCCVRFPWVSAVATTPAQRLTASPSMPLPPSVVAPPPPCCVIAIERSTALPRPARRRRRARPLSRTQAREESRACRRPDRFSPHDNAARSADRSACNARDRPAGTQHSQARRALPIQAARSIPWLLVRRRQLHHAPHPTRGRRLSNGSDPKSGPSAFFGALSGTSRDVPPTAKSLSWI